MLRITQAWKTEALTIVVVEGDIKGRWVDVVRRECARALGGKGDSVHRLVLDLATVSWIDAAGVALLRELGARGVIVTNCSPYVAELLKDVDSDG